MTFFGIFTIVTAVSEHRRIYLSLLLFLSGLLVLFIGLTGCGQETGPSFGIYLAENNELVLSEEHIAAYYLDSHSIELNDAGIVKWNSYLTYSGEPRLALSLFSKEFTIKAGDEEIYRGKFYSGVSSATYDGYVILESLFKLDADHRSINIDHGYPDASFGVGEDLRDDPRIIEALQNEGLLR